MPFYFQLCNIWLHAAKLLSSPPYAVQRTILVVEEEGEVPEVEWWDAPLLAHGSYEHVGGRPYLNEARITIFVEHPVPLEPPVEAPPPMPTQQLTIQVEQQPDLSPHATIVHSTPTKVIRLLVLLFMTSTKRPSNVECP